MTDRPLKPGWTRVKFGDVVRLVTDRCDPVAAGLERFVGLEHLEHGDLRVRSWGNVGDGTTFTNRFRPGQVLFGKRRAYQRKVAVADFEGVCSGDIYVFESKDPQRILPELVPFLCQTDAFFEHAVETSAGSLSPRTNWTSLAEYEFALPPMEEQRKIVSLLQAIDSHAESHLASMYASEHVVNACTEEAIAQMARVYAQRVLKDGCVRITDGTHQPPVFSDSGVPFFLVKTISAGSVDWSHTKFIPQETYTELTRRTKPKRGDVLYTAVGATYGVALCIDFDCQFTFQRHIAHIIPNTEVLLGPYIELFLNSRQGKRQSDKNAIGSAQPTVTLGSLSRFVLPFPPVREQSILIDRVAGLRKGADALKARYAEVLKVRQAVLAG